MDVSKLPAATVPQSRTSATNAEPGANGAQRAVDTLALKELVDIRPLDVPGALQILLAEVRLALTALLATAPTDAPVPTNTAVPENPTQTAHAIVDMLLQALPQSARDVSVWSVSAGAVEAALQQGFDAAERAVASWRDVPPAVLAAPRDTRSLVGEVLGDELVNPLWLRPEWLGLAPRLERYVRRRRNARRRLSDPDFSHRGLDDADWDC